MMKKKRIFAICIAIVILAAALFFKLYLDSKNKNISEVNDDKKGFIGLEFKENKGTSQKSSNVFVIDKTEGENKSVETLIDIMGNNGMNFYKSGGTGKNKGQDGLIAADDVVLIEINCQWDVRGGTNTDLIKSIIKNIVNHPDGFKGEIIVADNGQGQYGGEGKGGSMNWKINNAVDRSQSVQAVVDELSKDNKLSAVLWDNFTEVKVEEYSKGDYTDGFIINSTASPSTGIIVSYPKFKTKYGTFISFKEGVWDNINKKYDSQKLKVISVPVLKTHLNYSVTGCIKKYMGVVSDKLTKHNAHNSIGKGGMGTVMVETRMPVLNILDAIWVNPFRGPKTGDFDAVKAGVICASTDPAALDYWGAKNILIETAKKVGNQNYSNMNPADSSPGTFGYWLKLSADEIKKAGYPAALSMDEINVYMQ